MSELWRFQAVCCLCDAVYPCAGSPPSGGSSGFFCAPVSVCRCREVKRPPQPCLNPDSMHGAADQFPGSDY